MEIVLGLALAWILGMSSHNSAKIDCVKDVQKCEAEVLDRVNDSRASYNKVNSIEEYRNEK